jgi:hypothetical protein
MKLIKGLKTYGGTPLAVVPKELSDEADYLAKFFDLELEQIVVKSRKRELVEARTFLAVYLYEKYKGKYSYRVIGMLIGSRDHSTVSACRRNMNNWLQFEEDLQARWIAFKDFAMSWSFNPRIFNNIPQL